MYYYWNNYPNYPPRPHIEECRSTDKKFVEDIMQCGSDYYQINLDHWRKKDPKYFCMLVGIPYTMYQCAARTEKNLDNPFVVIGRLERLHSGEWITTDGKPLRKWKSKKFSVESAYDADHKMLSYICSHPTVMYIANAYWSILANDAWLLGGINSQADFRIVSELKEENLWNAKDKRMTVTARELIGLDSFGYQLFPPDNKDGDRFKVKGNPEAGIEEEYMVSYACAQCMDEKKASSASFVAYKENVQRYIDGGKDEVMKLLKRLQKSLGQS